MVSNIIDTVIAKVLQNLTDLNYMNHLLHHAMGKYCVIKYVGFNVPVYYGKVSGREKGGNENKNDVGITRQEK